jgi:hypothetical protein
MQLMLAQAPTHSMPAAAAGLLRKGEGLPQMEQSHNGVEIGKNCSTTFITSCKWLQAEICACVQHAALVEQALLC